MIITVPSKTFLIGEYAVMDKGPAILVNTTPRFSFNVTTTETNKNHSDANNNELERLNKTFNPQSPSALWIKKNKELFSNTSIDIHNPHNNQGGFGLSSAEFISVYLWSFLKKDLTLEDVDLYEMWSSYRHLYNAKDLIPSGADILSQWVGGVCLFNPDPFNICSLTWPFWDLNFILIRTGDHLKTWKYLQNLKQKNFPELRKCSLKAFDAIESQDVELFLRLINEYCSLLDENQFMSQKTKKIIDELRKNEHILATKGCGAMGAEVVCVFFRKENEEDVFKSLEKYETVGQSSSLTHGIDFKK